jgi:hypothetical protein
MNQFGRGAKATAAQRAEVERLAAEGVSVRQIAAQVFGDARFRGRVERILHRPAGEPVAVSLPLEPELEGIDPLELGTDALIRLLFERRLAWLAASGKAPSFGELRSMLEVQRRLDAAEALERLRPKPKGVMTRP